MATITRLPSGKYRAQVRKAGVYKARTFDRKSDATHWATDIERAITGGSDAGVIQPPKDMNMAQVIRAYLKQVGANRSIKATLERIARGPLGQTAARSLTAVTMQAHIDTRLADGLAGSTIASDLSALAGVLKWARRSRNMDINEFLATEARRSLTAARIKTTSRERSRLPTGGELQAIYDHCATNHHLRLPMATLIEFATVSAMRLGEICRLEIEDVDWNRKSVIIRQRKDPQNPVDQVVPLIGKAFDMVRIATGDRRSGRVFPHAGASVTQSFRRIVKVLEIEDLRFHDLRHLAITRLFQLGLPIQLVAVVSGHKDWRHLRRYTQLGADDVHSALERLRTT